MEDLKGLSTVEASALRLQHGPNEIALEKSKPAWLLFAGQFRSPLVVILIFACVFSYLLGERSDAFAIGAILLLNAMIGFFQEYRAETAIQALKNMTAPRALVVRDGKQIQIPAREVVLGDTLVLEAGDLIAADGILVSASQLQVNEAVLTGESMPVGKGIALEDSDGDEAEPRMRLFMGTAVASGTAVIKIDAIGMSTELGKIAHLIASVSNEPTPLQTQLAGVGKVLLLLCLAVVVVVFGIGWLQGRGGLELMVFSISLAVAAVPEGLPAIVTVALALGVQRMAARNALVRKIPSVETLGSVSVICTDKTGTLTTGKMRVRELWGSDQTELLRVAASCCDAELGDDTGTGTGDPTELAILFAAKERGIERGTIEKENPRVSTLPFDTSRRRMSVFRGDHVNYVKGAMESIFSLLEPGELAHLEPAAKAAAEMSGRGLRVLAVASGKTPEEKNLRLIGVLGLADPPRTEAQDAIREARAAGITPIMITGDHPRTAAAIARELGLVLDGEELEGRVHARATPEDKLKLVRAWKEKGAIVAMTGDGVNDAPALREAHVGIAMGKGGTEVTRQAADIILADDNFATIIAAIREGRGIYQNIRKAITFLLTGNAAEVIFVVCSVFAGLPLPLLSAHLLWINLVTDALPALTLVADPLSPDLMKQKPREASASIMGREEWTRVGLVGLLEASVSLSLFYVLWKEQGLAAARNLVFPTLVFSQLFRSFGARSSTRIFWEVGALSNLWLLGVVVVTGALQLSLHFIPFTQRVFGLGPLSILDLLLICSLALIPITTTELGKLWKRSMSGTTFNVRHS